MQKVCAQCGTEYEISRQDLDFYDRVSPTIKGKKYQIPAPKLCPDCRRQRRMSFRNERSLYARKCDLSGKIIISAYSPEKPFPVYHHHEWEKDGWDPLDYGRDYDFNRPFFEQFAELQREVPKKALHIPDTMQNCDFCNYGGHSQNCYLCYGPFSSENCLYSRVPYGCKYDIDGEANILSENVYQCIACTNCYECFFSQYCDNCSAGYFLIDCTSCENCFGCIGQKHQKYMFLNQKYSKEEYEKLSKDLLSSPERLNDFYRKFFELKKNNVYKYARNVATENSTGDLLRNCQNCYECFDMINAQDISYCELGGEQTHHVHDCTIIGVNCENCYEHIGSLGCHDSSFMLYIRNDQNCYYCSNTNNSKHCFGCDGLDRKEYCVLNKQYSKEEYEELVGRIIEQMTERGEWGEFFPTEISPFAYNETLAQVYFQLEKEEIQAKGWQWKETEDKVKKDSESEQISECASCGNNFKIIKQERDFYGKYGLPEPKNCPDCRYKQRISSMNPHQLYKRQCMNNGCQNTFKTPYSPERPETIFCENCYLKEVY